MRLKLDLHPIYNDSRGIETALQEILDEAVNRRVKEVEIIPGKGSGALKKSVIRFLQRPEVRARYQRLEKDSDNWGRLFIHFRHDRTDATGSSDSKSMMPVVSGPCACCGETVQAEISDEETTGAVTAVCPSCDSPNRLSYRRDRRGEYHVKVELDYSDA